LIESAQSVWSLRLIPPLRRPSKLVLELGHNTLDLFFSAPSRISVSAFEQDDEVIAQAIDLIEIVRTEFSPVVVDFVSKVLPLCPENVLMHCFGPVYFWLIRFFGETFSSAFTNG
jgi:hypothetical protein